MRRAWGCLLVGVVALAAPVPVAAVAYVVGNADRVALLDQATGSVVGAFPLGAACAGDLVVSPDGRTLYVSAVMDPWAERVQFIDTATRSITASKALPHAGKLAVSPDGKRLYVAPGQGGRDLTVIDTATTAIVATVPLGEASTGIAVDHAGNRVYVIIDRDRDGGRWSTWVIDTATMSVVARLPTFQGYAVATNPALPKWYVAEGSGEGPVLTLDSASNAVLWREPAGSWPMALVPNASGSLIYVVSSGSSMAMLDGATNRVVGTIPLVGSMMDFGWLDAALSADGTRLTVISLAWSHIAVVDTATNQVIARRTLDFPPVAIATIPGSCTGSPCGAIVPTVPDPDDGTGAAGPRDTPPPAEAPVPVTRVHWRRGRGGATLRLQGLLRRADEAAARAVGAVILRIDLDGRPVRAITFDLHDCASRGGVALRCRDATGLASLTLRRAARAPETWRLQLDAPGFAPHPSHRGAGSVALAIRGAAP